MNYKKNCKMHLAILKEICQMHLTILVENCQMHFAISSGEYNTLAKIRNRFDPQKP